jgi:hypothetical protein
LDEAMKGFGGKIIVGRDLMRIDLPAAQINKDQERRF